MEASTPSDDAKDKSFKHLLDYLQLQPLHPVTNEVSSANVTSNLEKLATFWARTTLSNLDNVVDKISIVNQQLSSLEIGQNQSLAEGFETFLGKVKDLAVHENEAIDPEFCSVYAEFAMETLSRLEVSSDLETVFYPQICITAQGGTWTYTNNYVVEIKTGLRMLDVIHQNNGLPVNMIQYNNSYNGHSEVKDDLLIWGFADLYLSYVQILQASETSSENIKNRLATVRDQMRNLVGQSSKSLAEKIYDKVVVLIEDKIENNEIESIALDPVHEDRTCTLNFPLESGNYLVISFNITDPLNIAILGSSGVGKSSFVNSLLGMQEDDEGAAQVDITECTDKVGMYRHQDYKGVVFWDLPGVGTKKFPKDTYLTRKDIGFETYDAYFIICCDRFTELDGWLAKNIQNRNKPICFVRTKVAESLRADKRKRDFNEEKSLAKVREYLLEELNKVNIQCQENQLFLVDNWEVEEYDFMKLKNTLKSILRDQVVGNFVRTHTKLKSIEKSLKPLLEDTADYLDKLRKDCDIAKVSGYSLNIAGGILSIVGGALTLATAGAAAPVLIAGISLSAGGGAVGFGNALAKGKLSSDSVKRTEVMLTEHKRMAFQVQRCISQLKMFTYNENTEEEIASKLHGYGYNMYLSALGFTASGIQGASLGIRGLKLAEGGLEVGAKVAARATIVLSSLFLVWDTVNLGRGIRDIVQNKECNIAQKLRDMAKGIQNRESEWVETAVSEDPSNPLQEMNQIKKVLECPVCLIEMLPPTRIYQCSNGHGLCEVCKVGMERSETRRTTCPTCNARIIGRANAMEQVARSLGQKQS